MALTRRRRRTKPNSPSPSAASSSVSSPAASCSASSSSASFPASSSSTSTIVVHQNLPANQPVFNAYFSQICPDGFYNSTTISNKDLRKYLGLSAPQFAAFQTAIESTFTQHPELLEYNLHQKEGRIKFADNLKKFLSLPDNVVAALKAVEQNGNLRKAAYAVYQTAVRLKRGKKTAGAKDDLSKRFGVIEQNIERLDEEVKKAGDIALQVKADGEALIPKIGALLVCMQELKDWVIAKELDAQNSMM